MTQKTSFKKVRLFKILRELNISEETVLQYLNDEGFAGALKGKGLNASITDEDAYYALYEAFASDGEIATRVREKKAARIADGPEAVTGDGSTEEAEEVVVPEKPAEEVEPEAEPTPEPVVDTPEVEELDAEESVEPTKVEEPAEPVPQAVQEEVAEPVEDLATTDPEEVETAVESLQGPEEVLEDEVEPEIEDVAEPERTALVAEPAPEEEEVVLEESMLEDDEPITEAEEEIEPELPEVVETGPEVKEEEPVEKEPEAVSEPEPQVDAVEIIDADLPEVEEEEPVSVVSGDEEVVSGDEEAASDDEEVVSGGEEVASGDEEAASGDEEAASGDEVVEENQSAVAETEVGKEEAELVEESEEEEEAGEEVAGGEGEDDADIVSASRYKLSGTTVVGKIDLGALEESSPKKKRKRKRKRKKAADEKPEAPSTDREKAAPDSAETSAETQKKEKPKAKGKDGKEGKEGNNNNNKKKKKKKGPSVDQAEVDQAYQETLRSLEQGAASRSRQRRRRRKRDEFAAQRQRDLEAEAEQARILRVTEFVSTGELANLMDLQVNELISLLFASGMMVSINQRLDADTISFVADEFGYEVEFITDFGTDDIELEEDNPDDLVPRAPVVTVMGHVDHGKTSLLDYLRSANVVDGEAGGITQHIGAYHVELPGGRKITFLDTPGHEAFTAMRARGAQVTDIVILVVAADDSVMPQTIEAINHAKAADVPILVAINKMDKPDANSPRVMQELAEHGVLVEQYGGQVQCSLVSAKTGDNIPELLEKILLEADLLELKANPQRHANGVVIESRLDKGRGTVATILVQNGTLSVGDTFIAGIFSGRVRAMFDERDHRVNGIGPALPALVLGFDGAPEVGDQFVVMEEEREAREIAQKRQQIHREQTLRQRKHITLDEIGRRLALGDFQELNLIVKADVGGSVEALSDSLLKLSTEEVAVNIIHSGVGAITESDVMLASASDAVIIGFQVRPASGARAAAEREEIDVRTYSIIYDAIEDVRDALEGLLSPEESEKITGGAEVRETFKVPRVGTVAGCYVTEGRIRRNDRVRLIRDGIVIYEGGLSSLKRFKDDVKEVVNGYECGIGMENYNDIKVGDVFEAFEIVETKRKLEA